MARTDIRYVIDVVRLMAPDVLHVVAAALGVDADKMEVVHECARSKAARRKLVDCVLDLGSATPRARVHKSAPTTCPAPRRPSAVARRLAS